LQRKCLAPVAVAAAGDGRQLPADELRTRIQHIQQLRLLLLQVPVVLPGLVLQMLLLLLALLHAERYHP
jgi:hypothetical protein